MGQRREERPASSQASPATPSPLPAREVAGRCSRPGGGRASSSCGIGTSLGLNIPMVAKGVAEIFYRFLNHINIVPLNGTTSLKHMIEDLKIGEFKLTREEINSIYNLLN